MSLPFSVIASALLSSVEPTLLSESPWQQSLGGPIFTGRGVPPRIWLLALHSSIFDISLHRISFHSAQRLVCGGSAPTGWWVKQRFPFSLEREIRDHISHGVNTELIGVMVSFLKRYQKHVLCIYVKWHENMHLTPYFDSRLMALQWRVIVHHRCYLIPASHIICAGRW